jgi:proline dehydrogenase
MSVMRSFLLSASKSKWLRDRVPRFEFSRRAVARFMPGEDLNSALKAAEGFRPSGIGVVLTYLGENVNSVTEAREVTDHYCDAISRIQAAGLNCEVSVKLTQLGHDIGTEISQTNLQRIIERAEAARNFVWIDMEDSTYTDSTLEVYRRMRSQHVNVGVCLQAYLYRTRRDLETLLPLSPGIRLVKGAYREPARVAFPKKKDVDVNFLVLATELLDAIGRNNARVAIATHDERLVERIKTIADDKRLPKDAFEFHMLYGIRTSAMNGLRREGYRGRVLISYGPAWFPWYMRRLAERPANLLFVLRNVFHPKEASCFKSGKGLSILSSASSSL